MLFVNKFFSHLKYCNITHDIPGLVFKSVYLFSMNPANVCLFKVTVRTQSLSTGNNKDTRATRFTPYFCASVAYFEQLVPCWDG